MQEYIEIGCSPSDEQCAQVGDTGYYVQARKECTAFINQLNRTFGDPKKYNCLLLTKSNNHDFGEYLEVRCYYETTNEISVEYAMRVEREYPNKWDDIALKELAQ